MNTSNICTKVTVRQAKLKNGMISLYLDYYPAIRTPQNYETVSTGVSWHLHLCQPKEPDGDGV